MLNSIKMILCASIVSIAVQAQSPSPFAVDKRLEMIQLLCDLAAPPSEGARDISPYLSLRDHAAVVRMKSLPLGFLNSDRLPTWALHLSLPPELKPLSTMPQNVRESFAEKDEAEYLIAIRDFAIRVDPLLALEKTRNAAQREMVSACNCAITPYLNQMDKMSGLSHDSLLLAGFMVLRYFMWVAGSEPGRY